MFCSVGYIPNTGFVLTFTLMVLVDALLNKCLFVTILDDKWVRRLHLCTDG